MKPKPEKTMKKQGKGRFQSGVSGNPRGRPVGARNKTTEAALALLDGEAECLTRKAVEMALNGDLDALRLCLSRLIPPKKDLPLKVNLPKMETATDAVKAMAIITQVVSRGEITPSDASSLATIIEAYRKTFEAQEFEERLKRLEESVNGQPRKKARSAGSCHARKG